jgi:hypothetical protein
MKILLGGFNAALLFALVTAACSGLADDSDDRSSLNPTGPSMAGAGPPRTAVGTGFLTAPPQILSTRIAGQNRIEERRLEGVVQGALEGTFVEYVRGVVHPDGQVTFQGNMEFTGTLAGCGTGFLVAGLSGRGMAGPVPQTEATIRLTNQSSSTLHAAGSGSITQVGAFLSYEVRYVCR